MVNVVAGRYIEICAFRVPSLRKPFSCFFTARTFFVRTECLLHVQYNMLHLYDDKPLSHPRCAVLLTRFDPVSYEGVNVLTLPEMSCFSVLMIFSTDPRSSLPNLKILHTPSQHLRCNTYCNRRNQTLLIVCIDNNITIRPRKPTTAMSKQVYGPCSA